MRIVTTCVLLGFAGCASLGASEKLLIPAIESKRIQLSHESNGPLTLRQAVGMALKNSAEIAALYAEAEVLQEEFKIAGDIRDPQLRMGIGRMNSSAMSYSWGTESGLGREWGTETEREIGTESETMTSTETFPDPLVAQHTSSGTSLSESHSSSTTRMSSETASTSENSGVEDAFGRRDAWSIGLRLYPPNPWTYSAQRRAAAAEARAMMAEARHAQVLLAGEVALLFAETCYLEQDASILERIVSLYKAAFKLQCDLRDKNMGTLGDEMLMCRRYVASESDLETVRLRLNETLHQLAAITATSFDGLQIDSVGLSGYISSVAEKDGPVDNTLSHRSDEQAAYWRYVAVGSALREARSYRIPWFDSIELSYGRRLDEGSASRVSEQVTEGVQQDSSETAGSGSQVQSEQSTEWQSGNIVENVTSTQVGSWQETSTSSGQRQSVETSAGQEYERDSGNDDEWYVGFTMNIPVFSWRKSGTAMRSLEHKRAFELLETVSLNAAREIENSIAVVQSAQERISRHKDLETKAQNYLGNGLNEMEDKGVMSAEQIVSIKAELMELERSSLKLNHAHRVAVIKRESAFGRIAGLDDAQQNGRPPTGR